MRSQAYVRSQAASLIIIIKQDHTFNNINRGGSLLARRLVSFDQKMNSFVYDISHSRIEVFGKNIKEGEALIQQEPKSTPAQEPQATIAHDCILDSNINIYLFAYNASP